jgi:hypothetical protein
MSGTETATPEVEVPALPAPPVAVAVAKPRRSLWPVVFGLGFLLLAAGEGYLWYSAQAHRADPVELAVLRAQMDDMRSVQAQAAPAPDSSTAEADLAQKYVVLAAELAALQAQTASDHGALAVMQANATDIGKLTQRMTLLNALGTARLALDAGQPLGQIPGAPPALAQFADTPPPRFAALRESFEPAARSAEAASLSGTGRPGFWARAKLRLEGMLTVSNGSRVVFGPPAAAALNAARAALADGDLAGAVAALQTLPPGAKAAMGGWLAQAQALLAAQAALVAMAQGS